PPPPSHLLSAHSHAHPHLHPFPTRRSSDLAPAPNSTNTNIFVRFSDDNGRTWSNPVKVNDDSGAATSHFQPALAVVDLDRVAPRSEEHTSELHHGSISYAVFCLKKKIYNNI